MLYRTQTVKNTTARTESADSFFQMFYTDQANAFQIFFTFFF